MAANPQRYEKQQRFSAGQTVNLEQLDLELPVEAIYEGVL